MEFDGWEIILLTGIVSLITSAFTACLTLSITRRNEVRKHILEERTHFYLEIFPVIDVLVNHEEKVFDKEFMDNFIAYKAKIKLLASKKTYSAYSKLFYFLIPFYNNYDIFCSKHDPWQATKNRTYSRDKNGNKLETKQVSEAELDLFDEKESEFINSNLPDHDDLCRRVDTLYREMRKDLGSNLK